MKQLRRILIGFLTISLIFPLASCKGGKSGGKTGANSVKQTTTAPEAAFETLELSDTYLVGIDYSYNEPLRDYPTVFPKVRYDKKIEADMRYRMKDGRELLKTMLFDLTDEQFNAIKDAVVLKELYELDPEESDPEQVYDGDNSWLYIYGKDGNYIKRCGGFCPQNKRFLEMRRVIYQNLPEDFIKEYDFCKYKADVSYHYGFGKYGVFLSGKQDTSKLAEYHTVVIDAQEYTAEEITSIHREGGGTYVFSYINIGSLEDFRPYYEEYKDLCLGKYEHWDEEQWMDVSSERWQKFILEELAPSLLEKGCDGFFVDNCDVYYQYPTKEILQGLSTIMEGLVNLRTEVIMNGGDSFLTAYEEIGGSWENVITGINQETVFSRIDWETGELRPRLLSDEETKYFTDYIEKYADQGAYIYLLEYLQGEGGRKRIDDYCREKYCMYYISDSIELDG